MKITKGIIAKPHLILIYGTDGVGKTTFASHAPNSVFLGSEDGSSFLDVARLPEPKIIFEAQKSIQELITEKHDFKTLVIDSLDWLEPMVWQQVCKEAQVDFIEKAFGGYGKGFTRALEIWRMLISQIKELQKTKKMHVIIIAHSQIRPFIDPQQNQTYDRYSLKLNEKAGALWREFVDCVLFCNYETLTHKEKNDKKSKAFGEGKRLVYTERRPAFDAKNRQGLPFSFELSWQNFIELQKKEETTKDIFESIVGLLKNIDDEKLVSKIFEAAENAREDKTMLAKIRARLIQIANTGE